MTTASWPHRPDFDGNGNPVPGTGQTTEEQYGRLFDHFSLNGISAQPGSNAFRVFGDVGGMFVRVDATGTPFAIIRGKGVELTAGENLAIAAAGAATRVDRVVLRSDLAARTIVPVVKQGVAGSNVPPALTWGAGVYEIPLALVTVAGGAVTIDPAAVVDDRRFLGSDVGVWTTDTRPTAVEGRFGLNTTTDRFEGVVNGQWSAITPVVTWADVSGKPATFPPSAHGHTWAEISGKPAVYPAEAHTHDDRYFTETEVNNKIAAVTWASLPGKPATFPPSTHNHSASQITSGTFNADRVPGLEWSSSIVRVYPGTNPSSELSFRVTSTPNIGLYESDTMRLGYLTGTNEVLASGVYGNTLSTSYRSVYVSSDGDVLGYVASTRELKHDRGDYAADIEQWLEIQPKWYAYKDDPKQAPRVGLYAEDVNEISPELVDHTDGVPDGIKYEALTVPLLSMVQQLARRVTELESKLEVTPPKVEKVSPREPYKYELHDAQVHQRAVKKARRAAAEERELDDAVAERSKE